MCDYCTCRDSTAIATLSDEHERILEHAYRMRRAVTAGDHAGTCAILDDLQHLLAEHTAKEEQGLFAQLRSVPGTAGRLDILTAEHEHLDALFRRVHTATPDWTRSALDALALLSQHILDEETDLFPYALYELSAAQWEVVEALHREGEFGIVSAHA